MDRRPDDTHSREALLSVRDATVQFGGLTALSDVSFDVPAHTTVGIIGPNGAGKTTLFNCVTKQYRLTSGDIVIDGTSVHDLRSYDLAARGVMRTFQNLSLCPSLTVFDNVILGAHARRSPRKGRRHASEVRREAFELLGQIGLVDVVDDRVADLPYGTQKRVEVARALMGTPRLLLLDEPAAGLAETDLEALISLVREIGDRYGTTILLVEHHLDFVMEVCNTIHVLNFGELLASGTPQEVQSNPAVIAAYLGDDW